MVPTRRRRRRTCLARKQGSHLDGRIMLLREPYDHVRIRICITINVLFITWFRFKRKTTFLIVFIECRLLKRIVKPVISVQEAKRFLPRWNLTQIYIWFRGDSKKQLVIILASLVDHYHKWVNGNSLHTYLPIVNWKTSIATNLIFWPRNKE